MKNVLLVCCLLLAGNHSFGQSTNRLFTRLNIHHPEGPTFVSSMIQDSLGFIWVGTADGLYRFDGYQFKIFRHDPADSTTLRSNTITTLYVDKTGHIWVGAAGALQWLDPQTLTFHQPALDAGSIKKIEESAVTRILEDKDGLIWIATDKNGLLRYDPLQRKTQLFQPIEGDVFSLSHNSIRGVAEDAVGDLWVATQFGTHRYDPVKENFVSIPVEVEIGSKKNKERAIYIRGLAAADSGALWVSTDGDGLYRRDPTSEAWTNFRYDPTDPASLGDNRLTQLYQDRHKNAWVGSVSGGLNRFDPGRESFVRYQNAVGEINSIDDNHVNAILEDRDGLIWVGTQRGVNIMHPRNARFEFFQPEDNRPNTLSGENVFALLEDRDGAVWIGTRSAGLNRYDPLSRTFKTYRHASSDPGSLSDDAVWSIHQDRQGRLWVGTSKGTLNLFDPKTEKFTHFYLSVVEDHVFTDQIRSIYEDEKGILWLGTLGSGLFSFNPTTRSFKAFRQEEGNDHSLSSNAVFSIKGDGHGGMWVATMHGGACYFNPQNQSFTRYLSGLKEPPSRSSDDIYSLFVDRKQRVWIGTANARLGLFNPQEGRFRYFLQDIPEGSYLIMAMTDDARGDLWLTTNHGLLRFTPPEDLFSTDSLGKIQRYTTADGLQDDDFNSGAIYRSSDGHIYIGGLKGFNRFHPDSLHSPVTHPRVILTDFQIFNHSVPVAKEPEKRSKEFFLAQNIAYLKKLVLSYRQRVFSVTFAAVDFENPRENRFAYRMEGFNPEWTDLGHQHAVTFTNLNPGKYTLQIRTAGKTGVWSNQIRSLQIVITPPWYQTWTAYLVFMMLSLGGIYAFYQFNLQRRLKRAEAARAFEMNTLKSRLYTNITHEFRTPLTVIMGMTENIDGHEQEKSLIRRNSKNLLRLVNQLMDLSKLDAGNMALAPIQTDLVAYLQYLTESFYSLALEKDIRLTFYSEEETIVMDFDEVKMQQIVYNLLSNALKFTSKGGKVIFHVQTAERNGRLQVKMKMKDTGIGIQPAQLPHIFDRFYQGDSSDTREGEGTGIGLALTKELVKLMGGQITATSTVGKGSEFIIWLPITLEAPNQSFAAIKEKEKAPAAERLVSNEKPAKGINDFIPDQEEGSELLIIEDNPDVVTYIRTLLQPAYSIQTADNGQTGLELAWERTPDLIICDVMMPGINGYEVCETLKNDERSSHIPIILLTAKATQKDKVQGLSAGADAFLTKPFHREELLVRLEKLVQSRKELQKKYSAFNAHTNPKLKTPTKEEIFLTKLQGVVEAQLSNPDLGVPQLCRAVSLSHMQVYRKLKALTGKTPSRFISGIRLHKAMEMLKTTELNVSEVAYAVGFSDPGYFSKLFYEEFGVRPNVIHK